MTGLVILWIFIGIVVVMLASAAIKIVQEYERGVIFRLGRLVGARGPGLFFIIPIIERMVKVDLRVVTLDVPSQEAITQDNVTVRVNAVVYFRVVNPEDAVVKILNHIQGTSLVSQTTLRSVLGQSSLDELLSQRDKINQTLQRIIDEQTDPWGVKVTMVEIKDVELAATMQRAMAAQAEAERDRRAKVIHADGEFQAAQRLADAAKVISTDPAAIQLRYLQTLSSIATERTNLVVFPLPLDIMEAFSNRRAAIREGTPPESKRRSESK